MRRRVFVSQRGHGSFLPRGRAKRREEGEAVARNARASSGLQWLRSPKAQPVASASNLRKIRDRWERHQTNGDVLDAQCPDEERLPRRFEVHFTEVIVDSRVKMRAFVDGVPMGDDLTDNAYDPDGYRFHDVFHLVFAAVLGWSPVTRAILRRKRQSNPVIDEVEDGGRAAAIEEGLSAVVFDYARRHNFLDGVPALDYDILRTLKSVTSHLEVSRRSVADWERAILQGYSVWRELVRNRGGRVIADLDARAITYMGVLPDAEQEPIEAAHKADA